MADANVGAEVPAAPPSLAERVQHAAQEELRRAYRVLAGSDGAYWERDLRTEAVWYSPALCAAIGMPLSCTREEVHRRIHPEDMQRFRSVYDEAVRELGRFECEIRYLDRLGQYRWTRLSARVWPGDDGRPDRMIGTALDVHEEATIRQSLEQQRQQLQQMVDEHVARLAAALAEADTQREQAQRANEAKSTFLAHMSHEIRNPLNGFLGLNELALREAQSEQQRHHLRLARHSGETLLSVINDVLDFSHVHAGALPSRQEPFDLPEALVEAMRSLMPAARRKGLEMQFDCPGAISLVIGDRQRVQQIALHLLGNAVKYTDSGYIDVLLQVRAVGQQVCRATLEVLDTGPGMSADVCERVFEPFEQGDDSLARRHGGTGLGLSIARGLAEAMDGELRVASTPGLGSTFTLELPLQAQAVVQPPGSHPAPGLAWVVDGSLHSALWLERRLQRLGWNVGVLGNVDAAVQRAGRPGRPTPDVLTVHESALQRPDDLQRLRAALPGSHIALLAGPDWHQPPMEFAAHAAGAATYVLPLGPAALFDLLGQRGAGARPFEPPSAELPGLPGPGGDVLVAEDNPVNQIIVTEMIESLGLRARLASDGAEAVRACRQQSPALVLMDLQMPGVNGLEATRQLCEMQRRGELPAFPIVALTAHATPQDRDDCMTAGMVGFLTKPVGLAALRSELARWVAV